MCFKLQRRGRCACGACKRQQQRGFALRKLCIAGFGGAAIALEALDWHPNALICAIIYFKQGTEDFIAPLPATTQHGSVQQGLSVAGGSLGFFQLGLATDKRYSLAIKIGSSCMKRNWDTIRELLVKVEACSLPVEMVRLSDFPKERAAEISYHMALLIEAGLVKGQMVQTIGPEAKDFFGQRLTWSGHEFLDAIRSDTVWAKTKKRFGEQGVAMTFELIGSVAKDVAAAVMKGALGG
jgi:Hypothetical protein (DUF2513)